MSSPDLNALSEAAATPKMAATSTRLDSSEKSVAQRNISNPKKPSVMSIVKGVNRCGRYGVGPLKSKRQ